MIREVSLETLPNVNIRDPSHDKNLPIMSVTGSINRNVFNVILFKKTIKCSDEDSLIFAAFFVVLALTETSPRYYKIDSK